MAGCCEQKCGASLPEVSVYGGRPCDGSCTLWQVVITKVNTVAFPNWVPTHCHCNTGVAGCTGTCNYDADDLVVLKNTGL